MSIMYAEFQFNQRGFKMLGRDWADPSHGFTTAHDMIEHFPDDRGTIEDEIRALGAGIWLRRYCNLYMPHVIAQDIFYTLNKYKITYIRAVTNTQYDCTGIPTRYIDEIRSMYSIFQNFNHNNDTAYRMPEDLIDKAIDWAIVGLCQAWDRYSDCRDTITLTFKRLVELFEGIATYHDAFWDGGEYTPPSATGMVYVIVDAKARQIDSEFVRQS